VVIDRCWNVLRENEGARRIFGAFLDPSLVPAYVASNLVRAAVHPDGLRRSIVNWREVVSLVLERVERAYHAHPEDADRRALLEEVRAYPDVAGLAQGMPSGAAPVAVLHLRRGADELRLFTLLTTIGTPIDVTAQELTIESFFPADDATDRWLRAARTI
jgi:hypothetical protein